MLPAPDRSRLEIPMTVTDTRPSSTLPGPRTADLEPWLYSRTTRPRSQYWDVLNARWASRSPIPGPRRGD
jgi:hypothetical protein